MNISTSYYIGTMLRKKTTTLYLTMNERIAVAKEINHKALFLFEYYLSVIGKPNYLIDDNKTAAATGLSLRTVKECRRKLADKNLFWIIRNTSKGIKWFLYCARKEGVYCKKYFDELFGYTTVREVYFNHSRNQVSDIIIEESLNEMESTDIMDLLDTHHEKLEKKGKHNRSWLA